MKRKCLAQSLVGRILSGNGSYQCRDQGGENHRASSAGPGPAQLQERRQRQPPVARREKTMSSRQTGRYSRGRGAAGQHLEVKTHRILLAGASQLPLPTSLAGWLLGRPSVICSGKQVYEVKHASGQILTRNMYLQFIKCLKPKSPTSYFPLGKNLRYDIISGCIIICLLPVPFKQNIFFIFSISLVAAQELIKPFLAQK